MEQKTVEVKEESPCLADLLSMTDTGTEVILTRDDAPIARLVPVKTGSGPRVPGLHKGALRTSNDFRCAAARVILDH